MKNLLPTIMPITVMIAVIMLLASCTNAPVSVQYYWLGVMPASNGGETRRHGERPTLLITSVTLSEFLRQPGMVMQQDKNRLHLSKTHLWAERLDEAVPRVMQSKLQKKSALYNVYLNSAIGIGEPEFRLQLNIDSLQPTDQGEVITSGKYQLILSTAASKPLSKTFYFKLNLEDDGYAHAVEQLEVLIGLIAGDVLASMNAHQ